MPARTLLLRFLRLASPRLWLNTLAPLTPALHSPSGAAHASQDDAHHHPLSSLRSSAFAFALDDSSIALSPVAENSALSICRSSSDLCLRSSLHSGTILNYDLAHPQPSRYPHSGLPFQLPLRSPSAVAQHIGVASTPHTATAPPFSGQALVETPPDEDPAGDRLLEASILLRLVAFSEALSLSSDEMPPSQTSNVNAARLKLSLDDDKYAHAIKSTMGATWSDESDEETVSSRPSSAPEVPRSTQLVALLERWHRTLKALMLRRFRLYTVIHSPEQLGHTRLARAFEQWLKLRQTSIRPHAVLHSSLANEAVIVHDVSDAGEWDVTHRTLLPFTHDLDASSRDAWIIRRKVGNTWVNWGLVAQSAGMRSIGRIGYGWYSLRPLHGRRYGLRIAPGSRHSHRPLWRAHCYFRKHELSHCTCSN